MTQTILLADDSVTIQKVIELTFMDEDFRVVAVSDGRQALDRYQSLHPDLVIADVHMPEVGGFEVARQVKALDASTPVLLLVGSFEPFDEEEATACGAERWLKKPFDSQQLQEVVQTLLAERSAPEAEPAPEGVDEPAPAAAPQPFELMSDPPSPPSPAEPPSVEPPPVGVPPAPPAAAAPVSAAPLSTASAGPAASAAPSTAASDTAASDTAASDTAVSDTAGTGLSDEDVDRIARRVAELLGRGRLDEVAWEVIPDLAEVLIKERLEELETAVE